MRKAWSVVWRWIGNVLRVKALWELLPIGFTTVLAASVLKWFTAQGPWVIGLVSVGAGVVMLAIIGSVQRHTVDSDSERSPSATQTTHGANSPINTAPSGLINNYFGTVNQIPPEGERMITATRAGKEKAVIQKTSGHGSHNINAETVTINEVPRGGWPSGPGHPGLRQEMPELVLNYIQDAQESCFTVANRSQVTAYNTSIWTEEFGPHKSQLIFELPFSDVSLGAPPRRLSFKFVQDGATNELASGNTFVEAAKLLFLDLEDKVEGVCLSLKIRCEDRNHTPCTSDWALIYHRKGKDQGLTIRRL